MGISSAPMLSVHPRRRNAPQVSRAWRSKQTAVETRRERQGRQCHYPQTSTTLPIAGERFTRKLRLVDGEQVIYVASTLENLTAMDKPVVWQEHATWVLRFSILAEP